MKPSYKDIVNHYEACLEKHGDSHLGVDWPKAEDVDKRYRVMIDVIHVNHDTEKVSLLDFGCGAAHLLEYILKNQVRNIDYSGLDISPKFVALSKSKFPDVSFYTGDALDNNFEMPAADYIVLNGVFTEKRELSFDDMWSYFTSVITRLYKTCNKGIAFNVMSKNVEWERDDLFHVPIDLLSAFLCKNLTRDFVIRNDYGLYEYTVYVYKR
ncbi:MAG TPA: class I SAM-dependent methyltransferase [Cyclobacteriaceae bacterium]|nr:class I SAM-dependent methyltransferase [Cyclobacteriaceae bacterium]